MNDATLHHFFVFVHFFPIFKSIMGGDPFSIHNFSFENFHLQIEHLPLKGNVERM
jgi:hypothetical protein